MPELPEVETTLQGIKPHIHNKIIKNFIVRQKQLRWPIPDNMQDSLLGNTICNLVRRGKYLIFQMHKESFIIHLGMSGRLRILHEPIPAAKHDHVDIEFSDNVILRYTDPRRFGTILLADKDGFQHPLINKMGIEPFAKDFSGQYLYNLAIKRNLPIKSFIMENKTIVGVGNIYATEALFQTNIHPQKPAKLVTLEEMKRLAHAIKEILSIAIKEGGTTLKDFLGSDGKPGYFVQKLQAYGRVGLPCFRCNTNLKAIKIGQRTTVFCPNCQK